MTTAVQRAINTIAEAVNYTVGFIQQQREEISRLNEENAEIRRRLEEVMEENRELRARIEDPGQPGEGRS